MMVTSWRKILLYTVILATVLKVWLPEQITVAWPNWSQSISGVMSLLDGRPAKATTKGIQVPKSSYQGKVVSVHDGDTIRVLDEDGLVHKIRLSNIDAPELKQAYGMASGNALRARIDGRQVVVNVTTIDRYQREVGQIIFEQQDINLWMLRQGHAWHYESIAKKQQNSLAYAQYQRAQLLAQQQRLGLWHQSQPIAPWQFRQAAKHR